MTETNELKIYIEELRQTGHVITTYTDNYGKLYILNYDDKHFNLDPISQLQTEIFILDEALKNLPKLPQSELDKL